MGCLAQGSRREQRNQLLVTENIVLHKRYIHFSLYTRLPNKNSWVYPNILSIQLCEVYNPSVIGNEFNRQNDYPH